MIAVLLAAATVFVSCDGGLIVSDSPAVWRRTEAGWEQVHGADATAPAADGPGVTRAACTLAPVSNTPLVPAGMKRTGGSSRDRSLLWSSLDDGREARFTARLWTGERYEMVIDTAGPRP